MERQSVPSIVKEESAKQAVILAFSLAGAVLSVIAVRQLSEPDQAKYLRMYWALKVKRFADSQVGFWQTVSGKAATKYNEEKL